MERWFDKVKTDGAMLFWVAEKFEVKDGFHAHGLLYLPSFDHENRSSYRQLVDFWQIATGNKALSITKARDIQWDKAKWNAINLQKFEPKRGAGGYCAKYVFKNDSDYDLLC